MKLRKLLEGKYILGISCLLKVLVFVVVFSLSFNGIASF